MTTIEADEAIFWLRAYHAETLALALECAGHGDEMMRAAHDIYAVPEGSWDVQHARFEAAAHNFDKTRDKLRARQYEP